MSVLPVPCSCAKGQAPAATLALFLGNAAYRVLPVPVDPCGQALRIFRLVKLEDSPTPATYTVFTGKDDIHRCDCPDYLFRDKEAKGETCKHIRACLDTGLLWVPPLERRDIDLAYQDDADFRPLLRMVEG